MILGNGSLDDILNEKVKSADAYNLENNGYTMRHNLTNEEALVSNARLDAALERHARKISNVDDNKANEERAIGNNGRLPNVGFDIEAYLENHGKSNDELGFGD